MNYSGIIKNDFSAAPGVGVTLFVSGCNLHCPGCHNPEAQNFDYGKRYTYDTTLEIIEALKANGIKRTFNIMGGDPLAPVNRESVMFIIMDIKSALPDTKIYLWTGYTYEHLMNEIENGIFPETDLNYILSHIDYLIDGPYIHEERDITLHMRGSRNQRVIDMKETLQQNKIILSAEVIK